MIRPLIHHVVWRLITAIAAVTLAGGCGRAAGMKRSPVDLTREFGGAEQPFGASRVEFANVGGVVEAAVLMTPPARLIYKVRMPERAVFTSRVAVLPSTDAAAGARIRVGLSDQRHYEQPFALDVPAANAWMPIRVDLGPYSGSQWSLFYRPATITWDLILNADHGGTVAWARPLIEMP